MKKPKIFYVEDEIFLAKIVSETLQSKGYDVVLESDGGLAVKRFLDAQPDVCLLDVMLPNKDGFAIADEIREIDLKVPIIFLTAKSGVVPVYRFFILLLSGRFSFLPHLPPIKCHDENSSDRRVPI